MRSKSPWVTPIKNNKQLIWILKDQQYWNFIHRIKNNCVYHVLKRIKDEDTVCNEADFRKEANGISKYQIIND